MSLEEASIKLVKTMHGVADVSLSKEVSKTVKTHAWITALIMVVPLFGFDGLISAVVLWHMYKKLCDLAEVPMGKHFWTSILGGFIVNVGILIIASIALEFIPVVGWVGEGAIGFAVMFFSGVSYLEVLARLHEKGKVKERFDVDAGLNYLAKHSEKTTKDDKHKIEDKTQNN